MTEHPRITLDPKVLAGSRWLRDEALGRVHHRPMAEGARPWPPGIDAVSVLGRNGDDAPLHELQLGGLDGIAAHKSLIEGGRVRASCAAGARRRSPVRWNGGRGGGIGAGQCVTSSTRREQRCSSRCAALSPCLRLPARRVDAPIATIGANCFVKSTMTITSTMTTCAATGAGGHGRPAPGSRCCGGRCCRASPFPDRCAGAGGPAGAVPGAGARGVAGDRLRRAESTWSGRRRRIRTLGSSAASRSRTASSRCSAPSRWTA